MRKFKCIGLIETIPECSNWSKDFDIGASYELEYDYQNGVIELIDVCGDVIEVDEDQFEEVL